MPRCAICFEDVDKVYTCKSCGTVFCINCGDLKRRVCALCTDNEEEFEDEEEEEEDEEEPEEEDEEEPEEEDEFDEEENEKEEITESRRSKKKTRYQVR